MQCNIVGNQWSCLFHSRNGLDKSLIPINLTLSLTKIESFFFVKDIPFNLFSSRENIGSGYANQLSMGNVGVVPTIPKWKRRLSTT
jgi:hypothetical protein